MASDYAGWYYGGTSKPPLIVTGNEGPHPCRACGVIVEDGPKTKRCPECQARFKAASIARAQRKRRLRHG
jgi:hypothetical protein